MLSSCFPIDAVAASSGPNIYGRLRLSPMSLWKDLNGKVYENGKNLPIAKGNRSYGKGPGLSLRRLPKCSQQKAS
jgi:hypothetical protein